MTPLHLPTLAVDVVQGVLLSLAPQGGQHLARRNAWAGMAGNAVVSRARREAEQALAATAHRYEGSAQVR